MNEEHDRTICINAVFRGRNICVGTWKTPYGDMPCYCICHKELNDKWNEQIKEIN